MLPALAVKVAVCAVETGITLAENCTLVELAWIRATEVTLTAGLLLEIDTLKPAEGAGPLMVAVHRSVAVPLSEALVQERPLSCAPPVPMSAITAALLDEELLVIVN